MKFCSKCKIEKEDNRFYRDLVTKKLSSWCKDCRCLATNRYRKNNLKEVKLKEKVYKNNHPEKVKAWNKKFHNTPSGAFSIYKNTAKDRQIEFRLTFDEFIKFWKSDCTYCDDKIETIGLDRIDSNKGYEIGNIVSCCSKCNYMKRSYTQEEFINHCIKIVEKQNIKTL